MHIRPAGQADIAAIEAIEQCAPSAWSTVSIASEIRTREGCSLVAVSSRNKDIHGWCCIRCTPPEAELLKIAVHPDQRRKGWGLLLIREAFRYAAAQQCSKVFLEVRSNNHSARSLYKKCGMEELALRKNYYTHPVDDAIIYQVEFIQKPEFQGSLSPFAYLF